MKFFGLTGGMRGKRHDLRVGGADGTHGVGVISVDIMGNTESEGSQLAHS